MSDPFDNLETKFLSFISIYLYRRNARKSILEQLYDISENYKEFYMSLLALSGEKIIQKTLIPKNIIKEGNQANLKFTFINGTTSFLVSFLAMWFEVYLNNSVMGLLLLMLTPIILIIIPLSFIKFFSKGENRIFKFLSILKRGKYIFLIETYFSLWPFVIFSYFSKSVGLMFYTSLVAVIILLILTYLFFLDVNIKFFEDRVFKKLNLKITIEVKTPYANLIGVIQGIGNTLVIKTINKQPKVCSIYWHDIVCLANLNVRDF